MSTQSPTDATFISTLGTVEVKCILILIFISVIVAQGFFCKGPSKGQGHLLNRSGQLKIAIIYLILFLNMNLPCQLLTKTKTTCKYVIQRGADVWLGEAVSQTNTL